jgi:hypothetical protein
VILLGALTVIAVVPVLPLQSRGGPLGARLAAIACAFLIGQMFKHAASHQTTAAAYVAAFLLAALPWMLYLHWRRNGPGRA